MDSELRAMMLAKAKAGDTMAALVFAVVSLDDDLKEALWDIADAIRGGSGSEGELVDIVLPDEVN
jgi:hypothetical protein